MGAEIKIYQSLWKNLLLVICCVIFAIGAIFIIADDSCKTMTKVCGGWLGVIFFGRPERLPVPRGVEDKCGDNILIKIKPIVAFLGRKRFLPFYIKLSKEENHA